MAWNLAVVCAQGTWHALVCYFIPRCCIVGVATYEAQERSATTLAAACYASLVVVSFLRLALRTMAWTLPLACAMVLGMGSLPVVGVALSYAWMHGVRLAGKPRACCRLCSLCGAVSSGSARMYADAGLGCCCRLIEQSALCAAGTGPPVGLLAHPPSPSCSLAAVVTLRHHVLPHESF